jgi:hypothetical protein
VEIGVILLNGSIVKINGAVIPRPFAGRVGREEPCDSSSAVAISGDGRAFGVTRWDSTGFAIDAAGGSD